MVLLYRDPLLVRLDIITRDDSNNTVLLFQLMFTRNGDTPSVTKNVHSNMWANPIMISSADCETLMDTSETITNYHTLHITWL